MFGLKIYLILILKIVTAPGYENKTLSVNVKTNENNKMNIIMDPVGITLSYHNFDSMTNLLANITSEYPKITSLYRFVIIHSFS